MDINRISVEAFKYFGELNHIELTSWELLTLEAIDQAVVETIHSGRAKTAPKLGDDIEIDESKQIPVDNVTDIRALLMKKKRH